MGHTIVRLLTEAGAWDLAALLVCQAAVALDSLPWNGTRPFEAISLDSLLGDVTLRINVRHLLASSSGLPLPACCHLLHSLLPPGSDGQLSGEEAQHIFRRVSNGNLILR